MQYRNFPFVETLASEPIHLDNADDIILSTVNCRNCGYTVNLKHRRIPLAKL